MNEHGNQSQSAPTTTTYQPNRSMCLAVLALGMGAMFSASGCEWDSFIDPSVVGRWEHTPTTVPILERIASIEGPEDEFVEYADVAPADLIPELTDYRVAPGDGLEIVIFDLIVENQAENYSRAVDTRGRITLPILGELYVDGLTSDEVSQVVSAAMTDLVADPLVSVQVLSPRQTTYSIIGGAGGAGSFFIPTADFRLLEALTNSGGIDSQLESIYVIRQTPLTREVAGETGHAPQPTRIQPPPETGEDLIDLLDELSDDPNQGGFSSFGTVRKSSSPHHITPAQATTTDRIESYKPPNQSKSQAQPSSWSFIDGRWVNAADPDSLDQAQTNSNDPDQSGFAAFGSVQPSSRSNGSPPVELLDPDAGSPPPGASGWVYIDGKWVKVQGSTRNGGSSPSQVDELSRLVTQRIIRVPIDRLLAGDARYNVIIRPGDTIRIPPAGGGNIYVGGQVQRRGVYTLAPGLTLTRLIDAAGGLSGIAIPERVDLTRMVDSDRQAVIRLNLRAIEEGTEPDVFLKSNDRINVGTNFWAQPLAVVRNGFRFTYGFGFLIDRNFGNDIFGAPPVNFR